MIKSWFLFKPVCDSHSVSNSKGADFIFGSLTEVTLDVSHMMTLEDELSEEEDQKDSSREAFDACLENHKLSREQREHIRAINVKRKRDFVYFEKVNGEIVNILDGLELHTEVFNAAEQKMIVDKVCELQEKGQKGELSK